MGEREGKRIDWATGTEDNKGKREKKIKGKEKKENGKRREIVERNENIRENEVSGKSTGQETMAGICKKVTQKIAKRERANQNNRKEEHDELKK